MRRFALGMMTSAALMAGLASQVQASSKDYSKSTKTDLVTKIMGNKSYQVYSSLKLEEVTKKVKTKTKEKKKYTVKKKVAVKKSKKGKTKYKTVKQVKYKWVTKTAYKNVKKKEWKFGKKLTASADFRYAHVQSKSYKVKDGKRYYYIYVDGRPVGYVNEKAFALSKANVVSQVSLVNNPSDSVGFNAEDAINYVTDQHGSLVDNDSVEISCKSAKLNISDTGYVSSRKAGTAVLTFKYGKAKATSKLTVRGDAKEGISSADVTPVKTDLPEIKTWSARYGARLSSSSTITSKDAVSSSHKYWATKTMSGNAKGADIETIFYHPAVLSAPGSSNLEAKVSSAVQGIDFYDNDLVTSNLDLGQADNWEARGHMVYYNMRRVKKYNWHLIPSKILSFNTWLSYIKNIKVSPYMKLGHGQSVGSTKKYAYVLANWNRSHNWSNSQELIRVKKSTMEIDKIWTFKVWNGSAKYPRIFLNADVIDDNTLLALFHNASKHRYEYWKISRSGDSFKAKEVGATGSDLIKAKEVGATGSDLIRTGSDRISNSDEVHPEVQGFVWNSAYDVYYIAFNDYLFKIGAGLDGKTDAGKLLNYYKFDTGRREFEGLSSYGPELYLNLNHPTETLKVNHITK
ncbi:hypothetical protein HUX87_07755 [Lactobacillus delbrueckii subsp. bulgaricus]|uniref:hypothetical protein n=1 Tax=Lactobacillus delbrueckii TaxID=1584 RepID=UPI001593E0D1|nr:hypothetical protein [Lactobacillus delbrueckii]NVH29533.1 hypothetical protein [Lactobacillus delbrueckii subsp. bulgaricus]NWO31742.1 hypothetical protein [Lactobacillus delbrueckii subsp. bulgaricus]